MAALCTGNYGLSQNNTDNSKEYFFVKLTDSAYRAVEEYQKNQSKSNTQATIQILGSGGVLSFPSQSGNGGQQFSFSIDDIEGSFECIQQTQNQLSVLGSLPYKMRIHANEDVYETTRHRMAVAEETKKNTCTREIKPNQTDIGRKVKLKNSSGRLTNIPPKRDLTNTSLSPLPSSVSNLNSMSSNINPLLNGTSSTISSSPTTSLNIQSSSNNLLIGGGGIGSSTISGTTGLLPITNTISSSASNNNINNNNNNNNNTTSSSSLKNSNSSNSLNSLSNTNINSNSSLKLHHHPHLNNHHQNYNSSTTNSGGIVGGGGGVSAASSLSSVLSSAAGSGTSGINSGYFSNNSSSNNNNNINNNNNSGLRNGTNVLGNNNSSSGSRRGAQISGGPIGSGNRNQRNGSSRHMPDITKKKIRERLIHLLALKPFKKPELYARLQNEGIREREKNLISGILKDISTMRDNTYNLKRQIWNDVNEDWPFYTEQELQMLKRRKPQNLTPPLSSDGGSSTSGQSPTSTHNGSPPPAVKRPSLDRERFYEEPTAKKQRISHFRKESNEINSPNIIAPSKPQHHEPAEDNAMSISYAVLGSEAARRISPREEMMNSQHYSSNNHHSPNINNNSNKNISNNGNVGHHQSPTSYNNNNINTNNNISSNNHINGNNNNNNNNLNSDSRRKSSSPMTSSLIGSANAGIGASSPGAGSRTSNSNINNNNNNNINNNSSTMSSGGIADRGSAIIVNNNHNNINNNINQGSNSSRNINNNISNNINNNINNINGGPLTKISYDFSKFTKIKSIEQRRLYKTEFENDYDEYRQLLNKIENVRKRFNMLAERLHNARNNDANYRTIRRQILSEYEMINGEQEHQRAKARFDYLHAKLAHIKALVSEFDKTITAPNPNGDGTTNNNNSTNRRIQSSSTSSSSPIQNFSGNNLLNGGSGGGGGVLDNNGRTNCHSPSQQSLKISPNRNGKLPSPLSGSGLIPSSSSSSSTNSHYLPKQENY